jgi:hypothetical protein
MRDGFGFEDEQFSFQPEIDPEADLEFPGEELEGEAPPAKRATPQQRLTTAQPGKTINARILWPALGFPAVIAPRSGVSAKPFDGDATRCICVLLLSDTPKLTPEDAARYLRYAPWERRRTRTINSGATGSFNPQELDVRNRLDTSNLVDKHSQGLRFGANPQRRNGVTVSLSKYVNDFYRGLKSATPLKYLHEIRVSEAASARVTGGKSATGGAYERYQLFWNKEQQDGQDTSDEMKVLLNQFGRPRRERELGGSWTSWMPFLMKEYQYEYGSLHPPYNKSEKSQIPTEVLHPLFIVRNPGNTLKIGHLTDTHVDVRNDVYERNLAKNYSRKNKPVEFNNWNKSFLQVYENCRNESDVVLMTGDLIDYGRGHVGLEQTDNQLGNDKLYHKDRNWFLFYYLLLKDDGYQKPVFTSLGNHDWRLNPYPPFAPNAPGALRFVHTDVKGFTNKEKEAILQAAHGPGHDTAYSYDLNVNRWFFAWAEAFVKRFGKGVKFILTGDVDFPGSPANTVVDSIAWYLLLINPFLDYQFPTPTAHEFLMLDFAEDEELGKFDPRTFREYGERAAKCLTSLQQWHVSIFTTPGGRAKAIGIHTPPIGPREDWHQRDLLSGVKKWERGKSGYGHIYDLPNGKKVELPEHPLHAVRPMMNNTHGWNNAPLGTAADYGSFVNKDTKDTREWFIKKVADARTGVRAVFAGHIHRQDLLVVYKQPANSDVLRVKAVLDQQVKGVRPPGVASGPITYPGPLYVNTTSTGPRGHYFVGWENYLTQDPGYTVLTMTNDGTLTGVRQSGCLPNKACAYAASVR